MIFVVLFSLFIIKQIVVAPQADQQFVCDYASQFNKGDYSGFEKGSYVSLFPYQLGIITILRIVFKTFGDYNYQAFQYINALSTSLIVLSGYMITKHISNNNTKAMWFYLILNLLCIPMYLYTAFVYGEILSTVCVLLAVWILFETFNKFKVWKVIVYGMVIALSIMLRTHSYIVLVANAIVLIIKLVQYREPVYIYLLVSLVGFTIISQSSINLCYSKYKRDGANASPMIMSVVMGLNDELDSPGWYNGYNKNAFLETDCNIENAKEKAYKDLNEYIILYNENPKYALDFFNRKIQTQWNSPMYQCVSMNSSINGKQGEVGYSLFFGDLRHVCELITKTYQIMMYGSVLFLLVIKRKEWKVDKYVLLISIVGGFIFSLIWEAKTRYVFPYLLMMIPYFATGLYNVINKIESNLLATDKEI